MNELQHSPLLFFNILTSVLNHIRMQCDTMADTALKYIKRYQNNCSLQSVGGAAIAELCVQFL